MWKCLKRTYVQVFGEEGCGREVFGEDGCGSVWRGWMWKGLDRIDVEVLFS